MYPFPTLDHEELLTLAHKTQGAAYDHDRRRLEAQTLRLFEALMDHVLAERPLFLHIPPADADLLERGQQRVVERLVELAMSAAGAVPDCHCNRLADDLLAELTLQASDERHALAGRL